MRPLLVALALLALLPATASARTWKGKATEVNDGDTIAVDVRGDGTRRPRDIRFIGVQAMELTRYSSHPSKWRGECHALEAAQRVLELVRRSHWKVRLSARHASSHAGRRLRRYVGVRSGGRWVDLGEVLMAEGHTLFMGSEDEPDRNRVYNTLGQQAALAGIRIWDPATCGHGPSQDLPLRLWANWDPPGVDNVDVNGEWIKVQNRSPDRSLALGGWWVRDSMLRRYTFPGGTVLGPGQTVTVHAGHGADASGVLHWGLDVTLFPNNAGDGAYLFDPDGDLRASMAYPCVVACADPNQGALALDADPRHESVRIRNVSGHPVDLYGYALAQHGSAWPFEPGTVLAPGASLTVDHPGGDQPVMRDSGGSISVSTFTAVPLACAAWGSGSC